MQRTSLLFLLLTTASVGAQSAMTVDRPALTPSPVVVPGNGVLANDLNPPVTNTLATNLTVGDLAAVLGNLQGAVQQALPALAAFNDSFVFTNAPSPAGNFAVNLGRNFSRNEGANFAANVASPVGGAAPSVLNSAASAPGTANATLKALVVLQNEIQEMLPVLNALNGGTNTTGLGLAPALEPGSVTNLFQ